MDKIKQIEEYYSQIKDNRIEIADKKVSKANGKVDAWLEAEGTAKQKEDYVKASVSLIQKEIDLCEADIEFAYNMIGVLTYQMELSDE